MDHRDHVGLIREGVLGGGKTWADLGSGEGAFTLALADLLGPTGSIHTVDRDGRAVGVQVRALREAFPSVGLTPVVADFTLPLELPPLDGIVMANSLHFVRDKLGVLGLVRGYLRPAGRLVLVEYDTDHGNPWVPFPLSFRSWVAEAGLRRHRGPGAKREREGDPRVAVVGVVLDEDQTTSRAEVAPDEAEDGELVTLEVQRVRHHDPIALGQLERHCEVGNERRDADARELVTQGPHLNLEGAVVPIDRVDRAARTEKVGQGEGERSFTRPEFGPDLPAPQDALPDQPDMVAVVHSDQSGARESTSRLARRTAAPPTD